MLAHIIVHMYMFVCACAILMIPKVSFFVLYFFFSYLTAYQKSKVTFPVHHWLSISYTACNLHDSGNKLTRLSCIKQRLAD